MANVLELYNRFKGGGKGGKMVYPLENQSDYLGKITFTPVVEAGIEVPNLNLLDLKDGAIAKGIEVLQDTGADVIDFAKRYITGGDTVVSADGQQEATKGINDSTKMSSFFGAASGETTVGNSTGGNAAEAKLSLDTDSRISLYLPKAIQIQDTVSYDNAFQLGLIGGAAEKAMMGSASLVGTVAGVAAGQAKAVGSMLGGNTSGMSRDAAGIIAGRVAASIPGGFGDAVAGAVRSTTRLTTNPNTRALFKDVPIRNFSFAFQLVPTSRAEARMIETIIKQFREELYPEALQAAGINIGYRFPNRFLIKVKYNNADIKGIKFLPVYMQSFNATYNSATGGMHNDGRFSAVDISMAFTETRAIAKADVRDGNY